MTMPIGESSMATAEVKEEQKVYVWLPRDDFYKGKHILSWTLSHFSKDKTKIVATFIISPLSTNYSDALLNQWRERSNETLDKHVAHCAIQKFKAEKLIHKNDNEVEGILELIDLMAVKNLVMGFPPNSKVAELVGEKANPSCKIWFIRNGNLLLTRCIFGFIRHARLDLTEATTEEIEMELQRRKKLHVNEVEMELQRRKKLHVNEVEMELQRRKKLHVNEVEMELQRRKKLHVNEVELELQRRKKLHVNEVEMELQRRKKLHVNEVEMELQRRKKLHVNEVELELREIYMEEIEEIPKTENDKKDPLKREIEQLELVVLRNQELDKKQQELVKDISDLEHAKAKE